MERLVLPDVPASVWDDFHAGRSVDAGSKFQELERCWSRARLLGAPAAGAPPEEGLLRGDALREHVDRLELIRAVGETLIDRATARVADHDFLLLLADPDGVVVRTSGGGAFAAIAQDVRLIEGASWSEAARGTNAIGTAAAANVPTEVHGHAHFGRSYHQLVCYAAPIRGLDGEPLAVLDATSRIECADPKVARIVLETARALEEVVRMHGYASAGLSMTRALRRSLDHMRGPAFLIESPGRIARANAAAADLGIDSLHKLGISWKDVAREALTPTHGGLPILLHDRAWRLTADPIATPAGDIMAALVVLAPGRVSIASPQPARRAVPDPFQKIFSEDVAVTSAVEWSRKLAVSELPVMLLAETGTGKELFANAIHQASPRASGPWHAINCGSLAPSLLEAELFGYAAGAFTDAQRGGREGLFHAASGGTLFLDEVAEMSPAMQAMLLRVVETNTFRRVGDTRLERCDVRIICATCRDLPALVATGAFRQDLFYRLKGATVKIPALRERTDVMALAGHLAGPDVAFSADASEAILRYEWPGNVRELKSALAVAQLTAGTGWITCAHLPLDPIGPDEPSLDRAEREALVRALAEASGNVSRAARSLGVARSTLHRMKRRHGLD